LARHKRKCGDVYVFRCHISDHMDSLLGKVFY
jgi:hypothetical protein